MIKPTLIITMLAATLLLSTGSVTAADQQQVYGSQLMTKQERVELHEKLRNARTNQEREQIRNEHHRKMQQRAKAQGVTLPSKAPAMGTGSGGGKGMNPGSNRKR